MRPPKSYGEETIHGDFSWHLDDSASNGDTDM